MGGEIAACADDHAEGLGVDFDADADVEWGDAGVSFAGSRGGENRGGGGEDDGGDRDESGVSGGDL